MPNPKLATPRAFVPVVLTFSLVCGAGIVSPLRAAQRPWIEIKSPHFRVLSDGNTNDARRVAREFELVRGVFAGGFPKLRLETGAILTVLAPSNSDSLLGLAPEYWNKDADKIAARFQNGRERQYEMIRIDQDFSRRKDSLAYYGYVQSLLRANFQWLPTWLQEGLSYFYGNIELDGDKAIVGAPFGRITVLRQAPLIRVKELTSVNPWVKYKNDPRNQATYVAESWALVHYLMFSPEMGEGAKLSNYYKAIVARVPEDKAFEDNFGKFDEVEGKLRSYASNFLFKRYVVDSPPQMNEKDFSARTMTVAETEAEIGTYRLWCHDLKDARVAIDQALRDDPNQPLALEGQGFIDWADNKEADARADFSKALSLEPSRYLSLFYKAMLTSYSNPNPAPADSAAVRTAMYGVVSFNSQFSPAYIQLAFAMARAGDLPDALIMSRRALDSEPNRIGYHLLTARILLAMNRKDDAAQELLFVAGRAPEVSRHEALDLLSTLPDVRVPPEVFHDNYPSEEYRAAKEVEGTIVSFSCVSKGKLVTQTASGQQTLYAAAHHRIGFSESLWFAGDHSTPCNQIERFASVAHYNPGGASSDSLGDWVSLEVRTGFNTSSPSTQKPSGEKVPDTPAGTNPKQ